MGPEYFGGGGPNLYYNSSEGVVSRDGSFAAEESTSFLLKIINLGAGAKTPIGKSSAI